MRILHVSSAVEFGGGEKHIIDLCRALAARGHDVFLAIRPRCKWRAQIDFIGPERLLDVSIRNSFGVFSAKRIADFVNENEIDIVHAHVARDYIPASIACIAAKRSRFILTRHVMFPLKPFNRFALKNVSRAIGVSSAVAEALGSIFPKEKIAVIPNGIEMTAYGAEWKRSMREAFRKFHGIPQDALLVGTVGQLIPLKGQRDLVLAAAEVGKKLPDTRFAIVGKDNSMDQRFRRELKRLARVLEIGDRILWLDWADDLPSLLAALDIYISPSHSESFGIATLEAMAMGLPVVATRTDGSRELIRREELLVPFGDPVKLAERLVELLEDEPARLQLGSEMYRRASENYSLEKMVESMEKLYGEVLDG